ncbi:MAG: EAL domain-containing protein, partial [Desulfovibrio sp.]|nr:EAL domain-containing protein [Desulfovibrio sp.]
ALIRWQRDGKWVPPSVFIPLAEEAGLVTRVDMFVLYTACRQIGEWLRLGINDVRVAVNMSTRSIQAANFVERVQQIISENNTPKDLIELEVTETSLMSDLTIASKAISTLHDRGIHVALDDFGTGYSSLRYLNAMPFSCLKVDKSFIDGLNAASAKENSNDLVKGTLALARGLGKEIVAEGVEDPSQLGFLNQENCAIIQGYIFSKPLSAVECTEFLLHQREYIDKVMKSVS